MPVSKPGWPNIKQQRFQLDNLVPLAKIWAFIDCENNKFLMK